MEDALVGFTVCVTVSILLLLVLGMLERLWPEPRELAFVEVEPVLIEYENAS